jgi:WD40 repeat protein
LTAKGLKVWWDRESMPSRGLKFTLEIRNAIDSCERLLLVIGPRAIESEYVRAEWEHALLFAKGVIPILRIGDYNVVPEELKDFHCPDFRTKHNIRELLRILAEPVAELGPLLTSEVPPLPEHFVPRRADLDRLRGKVLADVERPVVVTSAKQTTALQGMGGIGKTVLATAFARAADTRHTFTDGIVWLTAGREASQPTLRANLARTAASFGDPDPDRLPRLLEKKACLIVIDDIWALEQAEPFRRVLGPRCRLLITTRDGTLVTALGAQEHSLDVLSQGEALKLLADASDAVGGDLPPEAREVAAECGRLPLALALCGAQVRDKRLWGDLLQALQAAELDFLDHPQGSVMRSLKVSLDALPAAKQERYRELAVLPEDKRVAEAGVLRLWARTGGLPEHHSRALLAEFHRKALLRLDSDGPIRRISLHDLQHDYLSRVAPDLAGLHGRLLEAYATSCPDGWWTGPTDGYFFEHLAHHLVEAVRHEELSSLLLEYPWLRSKLEATDLLALIQDFEYLKEDRDCEIIQGAIRLSSQALAADPNQLAEQLLGRIVDDLSERLQRFRIRLLSCGPRPRLHARWPNLQRPGSPLVQTLIGHKGAVIGVTMLSDLAASWSEDGTIRLWDLEKGEGRAFAAHKGGVSGVLILPDRQLLSWSDEATLQLWDLKTDANRTLKTGARYPMQGALLLPDGRVLSWDTVALHIWDLAAGKLLKHRQSIVEGVLLLRNGPHCRGGGCPGVLTGCASGT